MSLSSGVSGLTQIFGLIQLANSVVNESSLIDASSAARVEPVVLVQRDLASQQITTDTLQVFLSLFSAFYLQAVSLQAKVDGVSVNQLLDRYNPNRNLNTAAKTGANNYLGLGVEDFRFRLPTERAHVGLEAAGNADNIRSIAEASNLAFGKMLQVNLINSQGKSVPVYISVRLMSQIIPPDTLVHILTDGKEDTSFMSRWEGWRSGRLNFISDLILCRDLIDARKKKLMLDSDNTYTNLLARRRNNQKAALLSGEISVAAASNMLVASSESILKIENKVGGRFRDLKVRNKFFEETSLMILAVVDQDRERVTIYYRGLNDYSELSYREMAASANKKGGVDIMEVLKALQVGNGPTF